MLATVLLGSVACNRASNLTKEVAYVNSPQVVLRDRLAPIFEKKGTVHLGEKVYVLEHKPRFSRVRNERGEEGWIADRYLIPAETYEQFEKLATDNAKTPVQARGAARAVLNLHLSPGRDTDHLFQLKEGDKLEILTRSTAEKPKSLQPVAKTKKTSAGKQDEPAAPALEDWVLVRGGEKQHVGWVLARIVDVDVPLEIAEYAEGQRIVSSFVLSQVQDGEKKVPQYLVMTTDNKDGLPWDFDSIRVFTWNLKRHRYETAYRERNLAGVFPVSTGTANFGKEGVEPTFTIRVKNDASQVSERKYRMIGPIVRRVMTREEQQKEAVERAVRKAELKKGRK
ncbi:MAG: SH3 domain-containing protein [Terriglobales bacterium]